MADVVNAKLFSSGLFMMSRASIMGPNVGEGGGSRGIVKITSCADLRAVMRAVQKGRREVNAKEASRT